MAETRSRRGVACLLAGGAMLGVSKMGLQTFATPQLERRVPELRRPIAVNRLAEPQSAFRSTTSDSTSPSIFGSLCGAALAAAACIRGLKLAMNSQGQGGRFNVGQYYMPKLKGAKKMAVLRPRKPYGSHGARKVPRRYELYDKLEEIDETTPWYTVISEPKEPKTSSRDVPIMHRYPWAGKLNKLPEAKQEIENDTETALEPYFGSYTRENLPPTGRRQNYVHRRGWPTYNYPKWLNAPKVGTGIKEPKSVAWSKDRRVKENQVLTYSKKSRALYAKEQRARQQAIKQGEIRALGGAQPAEEDDLDAALDTLAGN